MITVIDLLIFLNVHYHLIPLILVIFKVLYDDGEIEVLYLAKERWEFIEDGHKPIEVGSLILYLNSNRLIDF